MKNVLKMAPAILLLAAAMFAQDQNTASWRDDLDYLVRRIEIMHPHPYGFFPREEFYKLKDKLSNEIPGLGDAEIVISFSELLASLQDGHTRMGFEYSDPEWLDKTFHLLPFILYPFDDGIYILAGMPKYKQLMGSEIVKIGKMPVAEVAAKLGRFYSHDNSYGERKSLYYTLGLAEMLKKIGAVDAVDRINLTLKNARSKEVKIQVATASFLSMARFLGTWYPQAGSELATMNEASKNPLPLWLKDRETNFWFEYVPEEKMMFLQINSLNSPRGDGEGTFGQFCARFFKAFDQVGPEKLVIDIRANNGGNHVELPLLKGIIARPHIDQHDRLFLITGRVTYSAAVHFATVFDKYTNATIIGEPTAGRPNHYGAIRRFTLPNHPQVVIGCSIDYYQDSEPFDFNTTVSPDITTRMSSPDYRHNIDPAMNAVKNFDQIVHRVQSLALEMGKEYAANGCEGMNALYHSKKQELLNDGYNLEKFFSEFNDDWFSKNRKSTADYLDFLALAVNECPESLDLCYSLAVQFEAEGQFDEAAKFYGQCLQLNPDCHYAKMKLGLLELKGKTN
jgi:hypothetical protein